MDAIHLRYGGDHVSAFGFTLCSHGSRFVPGINAVVIVAPKNHLFASQPILFRHSARAQVSRPYHGNHSLRSQLMEGIIHARPGCLGCVPVAPEITPDMVTNFNLLSFFHQLHDATTVSNYFTGI